MRREGRHLQIPGTEMDQIIEWDWIGGQQPHRESPNVRTLCDSFNMAPRQMVVPRVGSTTASLRFDS
ncbi:hypothetical protein H4I96_09675 [Botrytis cinerea]